MAGNAAVIVAPRNMACIAGVAVLAVLSLALPSALFGVQQDGEAYVEFIMTTPPVETAAEADIILADFVREVSGSPGITVHDVSTNDHKPTNDGRWTLTAWVVLHGNTALLTDAAESFGGAADMVTLRSVGDHIPTMLSVMLVWFSVKIAVILAVVMTASNRTIIPGAIAAVLAFGTAGSYLFRTTINGIVL